MQIRTLCHKWDLGSGGRDNGPWGVIHNFSRFKNLCGFQNQKHDLENIWVNSKGDLQLYRSMFLSSRITETDTKYINFPNTLHELVQMKRIVIFRLATSLNTNVLFLAFEFKSSVVCPYPLSWVNIVFVT